MDRIGVPERPLFSAPTRLEEVDTLLPPLDVLRSEVEDLLITDTKLKPQLILADDIYINKKNKIYLPPRFRKPVLEFFPFNKIGRHLGTNKTLRRIRQLFW